MEIRDSVVPMSAVISECTELQKKGKDSLGYGSTPECRRIIRQEIFYDDLGLPGAIEFEFEDGQIERKGNWPVIHGPRKSPIGTVQKTL